MNMEVTYPDGDGGGRHEFATGSPKDMMTYFQQIPVEYTMEDLLVDESPGAGGDTSCCAASTTAGDMGSNSSLVNAITAEGSCKRKKLVCGSSSERSTPEFNFNLVDESCFPGFIQSAPSSSAGAGIKAPPTGSTDREILGFLTKQNSKVKLLHGKDKEVNRSLAEQDQTGPVANWSYVTTVEMRADRKTHLGYWKEKQVKAVRDDKKSSAEYLAMFGNYYGVKTTFQFHRYDGTKTNWFMHEYTPTGYWGIDLFMQGLRFRVGEHKPGKVRDEPTSPEVKCLRLKEFTALGGTRHRMRGPNDPKEVKQGESAAWQHFIKIYDRHPELVGSKVVYAACCYCQGVLKAGTENGTKSLLTHCKSTCSRKHLQLSSPS